MLENIEKSLFDFFGRLGGKGAPKAKAYGGGGMAHNAVDSAKTGVAIKVRQGYFLASKYQYEDYRKRAASGGRSRW
jgi:hypothetical protein